ncbi:protein phosphatase 2C domain-containing protein [Aliiglaciecola sp. 3_MG-2023]|uniref:PP2C family protein-serine/threonine phosphatase n=1 Tax=Aliiglaciecola sp. 3_MG-2023 TaxID=3062644 RepID=UPI0026E483A0|nr:protein phosphatase 2C domain-containing protein [Aliiglaciecola sp. 3_MG-2023]MDO6695385.1 protein phosphatase 2C domain-containing protein [Aliiglaciecola sp. 3_MG-2023]
MSNNHIIFEKSEQAGRDYNQDRYAYHLSDHNDDIFIVVADGVGGTEQGELAAEIIAHKSGEFWQKREEFSNGEDFLKAFSDACNLAIKQTCEQGVSTAATLTALLLLKGELVSAHAGDSRICQFDQSGKVNQTKDHSLAYAKFLMGEIREDELATHPSQTQLLNCLDGSESAQCEINHWQLAEGEYFALCTDGFWEIFDNDEILELIKNENRDYIFANRIDEILQTKPTQDNTTAVLCQLDKSIAPPIVASYQTTKTEAEPQSSLASSERVSEPADSVPVNSAAEQDSNSLLNWKVILLALVALMLIVLLYFTYRNYTQPCCANEPPVITEQQLEPSFNGGDPSDLSPSELNSDVDSSIGEEEKPAQEIATPANQASEEVEETLEPLPSSVTNKAKDAINDTMGEAEASLHDVKETMGEAEASLDDVEETMGEAEASLDDVEETMGEAEASLDDVEESLSESKTIESAEQIKDQESSASPVKTFVDSNDADPSADANEEGNVSGPADLNANLDSAPSLSLDVAPGEDPIAKLETQLTQDGSLAKGSKLDQTDVMKDQYAEIITVQLEVKGTPVYGAVLRYQKTSSGIEVIAGKVSNLPQVPDAPTHDFARCFSQYQQGQSQQNKTVEKGQSDPVLYIDPASSGYFWLTDIKIKETGQAYDLFLLDVSCEALRLVSKHVSH